MFTPQEKKFILDLARRAVEHYFKNGKLLELGGDEVVSEKLKEQRACFVTLTIGGELRGCIGHIEAVQPLYLDIIENAAAAAFGDPRFPPLTEKEWKNTEVEVSVLSKPEPLSFSSPEDLLKKLRPGADGVILRRQPGDRGNSPNPLLERGGGATYLPQVWEDLPDKEKFLSSLCEKAGLEAGDWRRPGVEVLIYKVEAIK